MVADNRRDNWRDEEERDTNSAGQSGDIQGILRPAEADSESVEELVEEGNALEASIVDGVENAKDPDVSEVTTYKGIKQTEARPGEWIAISGAGGLGHLAIQYAKAMGLLVCAIDIDDGKLAHATRLGADFVINAKTGDPAISVKKATGGGAHGGLITAPSLIAFKQGVGMTRKRGTCVLVGLPPGEFPLPLFDVVANCITIRGSFVGSRQDMAEALAFAVGGKVKADIELQPLSSINQIFERLEQGDVPSRVVLDFAPTQTKNRHSEADQQLATTGVASARDL